MQDVERSLRANRSLVDALYREHVHTILAFVRRQVGSREEAEDIVLEVFVAALESELLPVLEREKQLAWLHRVARNKCIDYHRRSARHPAVSLDIEVVNLYDDDAYEPDQVTLQQEEYSLLRERLTRLTAQQQEILALKFGRDLRAPEIARRVNKSESAVRVMLARTLNMLRTVYARYDERRG